MKKAEEMPARSLKSPYHTQLKNICSKNPKADALRISCTVSKSETNCRFTNRNQMVLRYPLIFKQGLGRSYVCAFYCLKRYITGDACCRVNSGSSQTQKITFCDKHKFELYKCTVQFSYFKLHQVHFLKYCLFCA